MRDSLPVDLSTLHLLKPHNTLLSCLETSSQTDRLVTACSGISLKMTLARVGIECPPHNWDDNFKSPYSPWLFPPPPGYDGSYERYEMDCTASWLLGTGGPDQGEDNWPSTVLNDHKKRSLFFLLVLLVLLNFSLATNLPFASHCPSYFDMFRCKNGCLVVVSPRETIGTCISPMIAHKITTIQTCVCVPPTMTNIIWYIC